MRIKIIMIIMMIFIVFFQYRIWIGDGSYEEVAKLEKLVRIQQKENSRLKERNDALDAEVKDLKKGLQAVEERARNELGMVKDGETFYQVIEEKDKKDKKDKKASNKGVRNGG